MAVAVAVGVGVVVAGLLYLLSAKFDSAENHLASQRMYAIYIAHAVLSGGIKVRGLRAARICNQNPELPLPFVWGPPFYAVAGYGRGVLGGRIPSEDHSILGTLDSQVSWLITGAGALCKRRVREYRKNY